MLLLRLKKQTSKNVADTNFKVDTQAQCNVTTFYIFNQIKNRPQTENSKTILFIYGGNIILLIGIS